MNRINTIGTVRWVRLLPPAGRLGDSHPERPVNHTSRFDDHVEFSQRGINLASVRQTLGIRLDKVVDIRSQIENGLYDVDGKLQAVVERLVDDLI